MNARAPRKTAFPWQAQARVLSAGIIPVRFDEHGAPHFLLLRAFQYWDFPKGVVEREEEPLRAAVRELEEETGIRAPRFRWGKAHFETEPYASPRKVAHYYLAEVNTADVRLSAVPWLGIPEHHEYRWVSYESALLLLGPRVRAALRWAKRRILEAGACT